MELFENAGVGARFFLHGTSSMRFKQKFQLTETPGDFLILMIFQ